MTTMTTGGKTHTAWTCETDGNSTRLNVIVLHEEGALPATTAGSEAAGAAVVAAKRGKIFFFVK